MPLSTVAPLATSSINIAATPSETVLFGAPLFSKKSLLPGNDAPYAGAEKVAVDHLARAMLKAAILGNERAGTLRIELRKSKALFGLWTKASLVLIGMESERGWPAGSLEAALDAALHGREMAADAWLYAHLREDSASPDGAILDEVRAGLAGRYALDRAQTKTLGFVTGVSWTLTETGERMRGAAQPQEIQALFAACEHERPEIWRALDTAILGAIGRRRESRPDTNTDSIPTDTAAPEGRKAIRARLGGHLRRNLRAHPPLSFPVVCSGTQPLGLKCAGLDCLRCRISGP